MLKCSIQQECLLKKGQVSMFFLSIIVTMIVVTFVTVNIGKIAKDKTQTANSADSGALSGASVLAYAFNYVANANKKDKTDALENNYDQFEKAYTKYINNINEHVTYHGKENSIVQAETGCCFFSYTMAGVLHEIDVVRKQAVNMRDVVVKGYQKEQDDFYKAIRERVHDDGQGSSSDLYNIALSTAAQFNFANSGTSPRLGKINQKRYSQFLQSLSPGNVKSGEPKTFSWVDGAARAHMVTAIITIGEVHQYKVEVTEMKFDDVNKKLSEIEGKAIKAAAKVAEAEGHYGRAKAACATWPVFCPEPEAAGDAAMREAMKLMDGPEGARKIAEDVRKGLESNKMEDSGSKSSLSNDIIKHIIDIEHDRSVSSYQFQFHMGSPVKGMRGDVDVMTFYPPVQSSATASFGGCGKIHKPKVAHDVSLTCTQ